MALKADLGQANPGQIVCVTIDGVDFSALRAKIISHLHGITGWCSTVSETPVPVQSLYGATNFRTAWDGGGTGDGWETANCGNRTHKHPPGTLGVSATFALTGLSPKNDDEIKVAYATGDTFCDLIQGYAPEVVYDRYDGSYHYVAGSVGNATLPVLHARGASGKTYFRVATDAAGTGATWITVASNIGVHGHANYNLALLGYNAPAGGGVNGAGEPKFSVNFATGLIATEGDVNDIGISEFYADYIAHTAHPWTGRTATYPLSKAGLYNGSYWYFECGSPGNWEWAYGVAPAHYHTGPPLVVGAPT